MITTRPFTLTHDVHLDTLAIAMPADRLLRSHRPLSKSTLRTKWGRRAQAALLVAALLSSDDSSDEELESIAAAAIAEHEKWKARDLREGADRGNYDGPQDIKFYNQILYKVSTRRFKTWARCVTTVYMHT
jgi:hypothetical protein